MFARLEVCRRKNARRFTIVRSIGTLTGMLVVASLASTRALPKPPSAPPGTKAPRPVPDFTLPNADSKSYALKDFQGRPVVLFFFCPCAACRPVAELWGQMERSGELLPQPAGGNASPSTKRPNSAPPQTLVVFAGDADATRDFGQSTGLDSEQTTLLSDPAAKTALRYNAMPCPRVFVLDAKGRAQYTNNERGAKSYLMPPAEIVSRTVDALRRLTAADKQHPAAHKQAKTKPPNGASHVP